jgi:hypothetical protein
MESKQFDELVARLANASNRRDALKGVAGGALASVVGVASVSSAEKNGKGKASAKKKGKDQASNTQGKASTKKKGEDQASAEHRRRGGRRRRWCRQQPKTTVMCHRGVTTMVAECEVNRHIRRHGDVRGACPYGR